MRKLLVTLGDELDKKLAAKTNQNEIVRQALQLYLSDITTDTVEGLRASYVVIVKSLKDIDSKIDYIAGQLDELPS